MLKRLIFTLTILLCTQAGCHAQTKDSDKLGMAIEYFQSGKYHEALLILQKLNKQYKLNPRFLAYMGVCYYYDWNYQEACNYLDENIPKLKAFSPQEQSVYHYTAAESHFNLNEYDQAIGYYETMLNLCHDNEKCDAMYRLGFCYMFKNNWANAYEYFLEAYNYYKKFQPTAHAKIAQSLTMAAGCKAKIPQDSE